MILSQFIAKLEQIVKDNPDYATLKVIASIDDEGNGFNEIFFDPSVGQFEDRDFIGEDQFEEWEEDYDSQCAVNSICIN